MVPFVSFRRSMTDIFELAISNMATSRNPTTQIIIPIYVEGLGGGG